MRFSLLGGGFYVRIAVFVGPHGVEDVMPAGDGGLDGTDKDNRLYEHLREEIADFDEAVRRKTATPEKAHKMPPLVEMT